MRTLHSNDEETLFDAERPVILTGIDEIARRGDLVDRCVFLHLPPISDETRRLESRTSRPTIRASWAPC